MDLSEQYDKIYRYCYFKVHHCQTAEDITQETFEEYRKNSKEIISETNDDPGYDPTEEWINSIALKELIYKLPQDEQELLLLRYANELPIASICKITGLSRFAIYRKISRILKYLKTELQRGGFSYE